LLSSPHLREGVSIGTLQRQQGPHSSGDYYFQK
jgi:hypothetical protein